MTHHVFLAARREISVAAMACACILAIGCGNKSKSAQPSAPPAMPVKIEVAKAQQVQNSSEYVATLKSRDSAVINPQVTGVISKILVHSGEHVSASTSLLQIDAAKQQATLNTQKQTLAAKEADAELARQQFQRTSSLAKAGVVSKQALDQARATLDSAESQLKALRAQVQQENVQLHYYSVDSPASGIVGDIPVHVGDTVTPSTVLTTINAAGGLEVYINVPLERAPDLKVGLPVDVLDTNGNVLAHSTISFVSPQVDNTTQTVLAKARITGPNTNLRTLQFVLARVIWGTTTAPLVPVLAVSQVAGQYFAFVAEQQNGKLVAQQKPLKVGDVVGNNYVVLSGISPGDKVIVSGTQSLVNGAPVMPIQS